MTTIKQLFVDLTKSFPTLNQLNDNEDKESGRKWSDYKLNPGLLDIRLLSNTLDHKILCKNFFLHANLTRN